MGRRAQVLTALAVLLSLSFLFARTLQGKSVDRFAIWDSALATAVAVLTSTPAGNAAALATRPIGLTTSTGVSVMREDSGSEALRVWLVRALDLTNDHVSAHVPAVSTARRISAGTTEDEFQVKGAAGTLVGISATNAHATNNAFVKCADQVAASTTPGTTAVAYSVMVPAGGGVVEPSIGQAFATGITCWLVLGKADSAVDEVAANDLHVNVRFR